MEKRDFKAETRGEGAVTEQKKLPVSAESHSISIELYASKYGRGFLGRTWGCDVECR
jgi:hypothetical protein